MRGSAKPQLNYKCIIGCQCQQETGSILKYMDSEQLKIHKTGLSTTLKLVVFVNFKTSQPTNISEKTEGTALNGDLSNPQINENFLI